MGMSKRLSCFITPSLSGHAAGHRAMARVALFSDSSLRVRYRRYQHHMQKARVLDAKATSLTLSVTVQEVLS